MIRRLAQDPRLVLLLLALILVSGIAGFSTRKSREDPVSQVRWGYVTTQLNGASPQEVESMLSEPIEQVLREVGSIRSIESASLRGTSLVFIRLNDEVDDVRQSWLKIQDKLSEVRDRLPPLASTPVLVDERRWGAHTQVIALYQKEGHEVAPGVLARWTKELGNRLGFVTGTRFTEMFGIPEEEVLVELDAETIAATRIPIDGIAKRLRSRDSAGSDVLSNMGADSIPVGVSGDITTLDEISALLVRQGDGNEQLRLGDLASVRRGERSPRGESVFIGGLRGTVIACRMDDGYGVGPWTERQAAEINRVKELLPEELGITELFSQKRYTDRRARDLYLSLGLGMLGVVAVVCVLMGWRAAIPVCASLPLTLCIVFFLMVPAGIELHQMSIAGLILALGMLIDNPIIVVDDIQRRLNGGSARGVAADQSVKHLLKPLVGSNVTTILGFTPILLIGGPTGEFMEQLGWSVIASLVASLTLSFTLVPVLCVWVLTPARVGADQSEDAHSESLVALRWCRSLYRRCITWSLSRPRWTVLVSVGVCAVGFLLVERLPEQFFPAAERDHFHFSIRLPTHVSIERTERVALRARKMLMEHPAVTEVSLFVGRSAPKLHYSMVALEDNRRNFAQGLVQVRGDSVPVQLIRDLQHRLDEEIAEAQCVVSLIEQGPPAPAPIELRLYGPSLETLRSLGESARATLMTIPGVIHTRSSLEIGMPTLALSINQADSEKANLSDERISRQIRDAVDGHFAMTMREGVEEVPVRVRLAEESTATPEQILTVPLVTANAQPSIIALQSIASWSLDQEIFSLYRRNASRCNIVYAYVAPGSLPIPIEQQFRERWHALQSMDAGYRYDFGGVSSERDTAVGNLTAYLAIVCVLIATTLVLTVGAFRFAIVIATVGGLSIGLGLTSLWIFGYPIGITAIIGIAGLLGLSVNDSIVVLTDCQAAKGSAEDLVETVVGSTRHVLTTSLTTIAGVVPLILQGGSFFPPMMVVIAFGVAGATILALGFTPASFSVLRRQAARLP